MRKLTQEQFIQKAKKIHNNKYDYSQAIYKISSIKIKIICHDHGAFEQTPSNHLFGQGCPICKVKNIIEKQLMTQYEFINKANNIHNNKYDYSQTIYKGSYQYLYIKCFKHGEFKQKAHNHLIGQGCPKCKANNSKILHSDTKEIFLDKVKLLLNEYDYSLVNYINSSTKIKIICPKHGIFEQTPNNHLSGKQGCPICNDSKGEKYITNYLKTNNHIFERQKTFKDCINICALPFDFYLTKYNICIEYDGKQHYAICKHFGGEKAFNELKNRDEIKNNYCKNNNIKLIRISYKDSIINRLNEELWNKE